MSKEASKQANLKHFDLFVLVSGAISEIVGGGERGSRRFIDDLLATSLTLLLYYEKLVGESSILEPH